MFNTIKVKEIEIYFPAGFRAFLYSRDGAFTQCPSEKRNSLHHIFEKRMGVGVLFMPKPMWAFSVLILNKPKVKTYKT